MPRHSDVEGRVIVALRSGFTTVRDIAKLTSLPSESVRSCLARMRRAGKVRIVGYQNCAIVRGMPTGARRAVYAIV
jgi:hypothetical protein